MRVRVSYLSLLRDATGKKEEEIEVPPHTTVDGLIKILMEKYGEKMKPLLDPSAEMGQAIIMTLNGELLSSSDMSRELEEGADIMVGLPPFGG